MSESPIDRLLGTPDRCTEGAYASVHWYPPGASAGDPCHCGKNLRRPDDEYDTEESP